MLGGEQTFERIGCATCHIPKLPLDKQGWIFVEPNPFNPPGNLRTGEVPDVKVDLSSDSLPAPRLEPDASGTVWVDAYTDLKLHDICGRDSQGSQGEREPLDQNAAQWSAKLMDGNCRFLTKRLWGAANEPPFFHHGLFTTLRRSVLAHDGEARDSRRAFEALPKYEQDCLIEFLKTLQVLPPGTKDRIVDEKFQARTWPPESSFTDISGDSEVRLTASAKAPAVLRSLERRRKPDITGSPGRASRQNDSRWRVAANGAALLGTPPPDAEAPPATGAVRRAPGGAVRGQDPSAAGVVRQRRNAHQARGNNR